MVSHQWSIVILVLIWAPVPRSCNIYIFKKCLYKITRLIFQKQGDRCPPCPPSAWIMHHLTLCLESAEDWSNMPWPANVRAAKVQGFANMALNMSLGEMEAQSSALTCCIGKKPFLKWLFFSMFSLFWTEHILTLISTKDNPQQNEWF